MFTILDKSQGHILGLEICGKIDIEQEKELIAKAESVLSEHDKLSLLVVVNPGISATVEAAFADMKWLLTHLNKLDKLAIVADSKFLGYLVSLDAKFASLIGIGEKHFNTEELEQAWEWIES